MSITENIVSELKHNSALFASLHGVRSILEKELDLKNLLIATDDTIMAELKRKNLTEYPYSYLAITELIGIKDQNANRVTQRFGQRAGVSAVTKATTGKSYLFPINVGMELKYIDNNPQRIILMAEALVILSLIGGLSFKLSVGGLEFIVRIEIPESTAIPLASAEATNEPDGTEISVNMVLHTYAGFFRDVSAVQSSDPVQTFSFIKIDGGLHGR